MPRYYLLLACLVVAIFATAAEKSQTWLEVRSPNFTVISNAGEKQARSVVNQFEQIRALFEQTYKARVDPGKPIIIFAVKDERALRELLPEYWEQKGRAQPAGVFQRGQEKNYVALRMNTTGENPYKIIYHEYVHLLCSLNFKSLPLWLNEGLAEFYGNTAIREGEIDVGMHSSPHLLLLREERLLPLNDLFAADHKSPHYNEKNKASIFYAQSWALTHYLLIAEQTRKNNLLSKFVVLIEKGIDETKAIEAAFGATTKLEKDLRDYIGQRSFNYMKIKSPAKIANLKIEVRQLAPGEVAAASGDFYLHTGRKAEARASLDEALRLDPTLAAAHESIGFLHMREDNSAEAAKWLEKAVTLDSRSYLAHYYHAVLTSAAKDPAASETHLRRAIELNPNFAPSYSTLAGLVAADQKRLVEAAELARRAVQLEPGMLHHRVALANVIARQGQYDEAEKMVRQSMGMASEPSEVAAAESFLAAIQRYREQLAYAKEREQKFRELVAEREKQIVQRRPGEVVEVAETGHKVKAEEIRKADEVFYDGVVRSVACKGGAIQVNVMVNGLPVIFTARDRAKVKLTSQQGVVMSGFDICRDIWAMNVRAVCGKTKGELECGELIEIELR